MDLRTDSKPCRQAQTALMCRRMPHAGCRRPEGPRDRRRDRSADRRREPERREPERREPERREAERSERSARDGRGRPASYRDARDRPVRDQGRDVRDGDRGFRLQGRDADPRARRYDNDRDRGYRPPSRLDSAITE